MKTKVYLSKSNACSALQLACVRKYLSELNVEVLEYDNESVFKSNLKKSEYLIVVPPEISIKDTTAHIGKGQTIEIESFLEHSYSGQVLIVTDAWKSFSGSTTVIAAEYLDLELHNFGKDWSRYSTLTFEAEDESDLCYFMETEQGEPVSSYKDYGGNGLTLKAPGTVTISEATTQTSMYLLIG